MRLHGPCVSPTSLELCSGPLPTVTHGSSLQTVNLLSVHHTLSLCLWIFFSGVREVTRQDQDSDRKWKSQEFSHTFSAHGRLHFFSFCPWFLGEILGDCEIFQQNIKSLRSHMALETQSSSISLMTSFPAYLEWEILVNSQDLIQEHCPFSWWVWIQKNSFSVSHFFPSALHVTFHLSNGQEAPVSEDSRIAWHSFIGDFPRKCLGPFFPLSHSLGGSISLNRGVMAFSQGLPFNTSMSDKLSFVIPTFIHAWSWYPRGLAWHQLLFHHTVLSFESTLLIERPGTMLY
jgi:hypothetical protein